jgi:hypothetical protein
VLEWKDLVLRRWVTLQPCWGLLIVVFLLVEAVSRAESEGLRRLAWVGFFRRQVSGEAQTSFDFFVSSAWVLSSL